MIWQHYSCITIVINNHFVYRPGGCCHQHAPPPVDDDESEDNKYRDVQPKTYQVLQKELPHAAAAGLLKKAMQPNNPSSI